MSKIICMGDSLTEGYGIGAQQRWTDLLAVRLGITVLNRGISGDTTGGMLARFNPDVIVHRPDQVIIMGGTNDISHRLSDDHILSNIYAMTRQARHYNINAVIGLPTLFFPPQPDVSTSMWAKDDILKSRLEHIQDQLRQFAVQDDRPYIDFSYEMTADHFMADGLHPNEAGHQIMMNNAYAVLIRQIRP